MCDCSQLQTDSPPKVGQLVDEHQTYSLWPLLSSDAATESSSAAEALPWPGLSKWGLGTRGWSGVRRSADRLGQEAVVRTLLCAAVACLGSSFALENRS